MATGGAENLAQNLRDQFLQCKICLDGLKEPKTLPCLHTFCADCLHFHIGHRRIDERKFPCPICRRHIYIPKNGVDGFPDSFFLQTLNDMVVAQSNQQDATPQPATGSSTDCGICKYKDSHSPASSECLECQIRLCDDCARSHTTAKITEGHTVISLPPPQPGGLGASRTDTNCRVHKAEAVKFYCETCSAPVCLPCTFLDHSGHEVVEIRTVREAFARDMEQLVMKSSDNLLQLTALKEDLNDLENELFVRKELIKGEVRRAVQGLIHKMSLQERQLLDNIDLFYDTVTVARDRQKVERTMAKLQRSHDFVKQLLEPSTSPIQQLSCRRDATEGLESAQKYELPDVMVHASKLDCYMHFLPGSDDVKVGQLLTCTLPAKPHSVSDLRNILPSRQAMYLHRLAEPVSTLGDIQHIGDVVTMAFLPSSNLVVLSTGTQTKVKIYSSKGRLRFEFGGEDELQQPTDLTITGQGEIAITDCGFQRVVTFDQFGRQRDTFGNGELFGQPVSLAVDCVGRIMVCDQAKQRITVHRGSGGSGLVFGELLNILSISHVPVPDIIRYHTNKLYVTDASHDTVFIYVYNSHILAQPNQPHNRTTEDDEDTEDDDETLRYMAKFQGAGQAQMSDNHHAFITCSGIGIGPNGDLIVADTMANQIRIFNTYGELSHLKAMGKQFFKPTLIAMSACGLMAVCQQGMRPVIMPEAQEVSEETGSTDLELPADNEVCIYRLIPADF